VTGDPPERRVAADARRVVRVLPEGTIDKTFDYLVPDELGDQVRVGTLVRVELNRRRVRAWVVDDGVAPPPGVALRPIAKVTGWGPPPELVTLAAWAAWRWAGRRSWFLGTASPSGAVRQLPASASGHRIAVPATAVADLASVALAGPRSVVRLPPLTDPFALVLAATGHGPALVLAPSVAWAARLGGRLRRAGASVAVLPDDWALARSGVDVVVGTRAGAWAPMTDLAVAVVLDEHDEVYQEEQTTTWHAREVVAERARRTGVPCMMVSPAPSLEALAWAGTSGVVVPARRVERDGWPLIEIVDRRSEDPGRGGLYSEQLVRFLRSEARVVCVLNRRGRARLLACGTCGEAARCETCQAAVGQSSDGLLSCRRCGMTRPVVCQACGSVSLRNLRVGVTRAREELEALVREPVLEISGAPGPTDGRPVMTRVVVGTEAVLHQVSGADVVAFLDIDQELLAPRYRAADQALALLVRGARLLARGVSASQPGARRPVGEISRTVAGRLLVQTRLPDHEVLQAVVHADPGRVADAERARREQLRFPPVAALAAVSGPAAQAFIDALEPSGIEVLGPADGRWLVRADDHRLLCDRLAATPRPGGRLRIEVDPLRI
jgi:primosomal protein N' (replication factor Y) (superfamily II helicase)